MDNEQDIIDLIKKAPPIRPPDDFTPKVMAVVMQVREGIYARAWNFLATSREFTLDPIRALRGGFSPDETAIYFFMVACAHLTLAIVLLMGLKNIDAGALMPPLLRLQPWLSLFLAGWLGFWGFLLKKNMKSGIKGSKFASLIYIEVVVINGALLLIEFNRILFLIPFFTTMVAISVAAGIFLAVSCSIENISGIKGPPALT